MKYRRKQTVEAFKYDGDFMNQDGKYYIPDWAIKLYKWGDLVFEEYNLYLRNDFGEFVKIEVGEYIIKDEDENISFDTSEHFESTYELVKE